VCRDWLLELARKDAEEGCPRVSRLKSDNAMYFMDLTKDWSVQQRGDLLCARVRWLFNKNYGHSQSELTEAERAAESHWDYPFFGRNLGTGPYRSPGKPGVEIARPSGRRTVVDADKAESVHRLDRMELGEFKIDKKRLKGAVKTAMLPAFGTPKVAGPLWQYITNVDGLTVSTRLDFGGRQPSQLRYHQWIHSIKDGKRVWLLDHGGIGSLLGSPRTEWRYLTDADIPEAANLLVQVCKEFVEAVPGLWARSGLTGLEGEPS
jgi:hypothetical protein